MYEVENKLNNVFEEDVDDKEFFLDIHPSEDLIELDWGFKNSGLPIGVWKNEIIRLYFSINYPILEDCNEDYLYDMVKEFVEEYWIDIEDMVEEFVDEKKYELERSLDDYINC